MKTFSVYWSGGTSYFGTDRTMVAETTSVACAYALAEQMFPKGFDRVHVYTQGVYAHGTHLNEKLASRMWKKKIVLTKAGKEAFISERKEWGGK
jgi:hypothetical protein